MTPAQNDLILWRLDDVTKSLQRVEEKMETLIIDVAMLKVKAGAWGAIAGMVPASVAAAVLLLTQ